MKRKIILIAGLLLFFWINIVSAAAPNAPLTPLCEGEGNPVGVTNSMPEFSWTFSDDDVEDSQSAYQILVASVEGNLSTGPYMWDSEKTLSSTSSATYNGSTLLWDTTYYWKVRTWDTADSTGVYCSTQTFKTGLFLLKESSAESDATWSIGLGDLDNDGNLDYIAGNAGANRIYINTGGTFSLKESSTETNATRCICIGDLNNDGNLDYIAGNNSESYGDRIYKNTGGGSFSILQEIAEKELTQCNCLGDIDNDGDLDYVSRNMSDQPTRVYKNTGDGNFSLFQDLAKTGDSYNGGMAFADIDADGDLDLLCGRTGIYKNTGEGNFTLYSSIGGNGIAVGDIDNDGDLDCIRVWAYTANWCKNDGSGNFQIGSDFDAGLYRDNMAVSLGDIDNDGDLDVIVGADYPTAAFIGGSVIYLNEGNFNFSLLEKSSIKERVYSVGFGDIDNDGDLDYISANRGGKNRIYKSGWVDIGNNANTAPLAPTTFNSSAVGGKVQLTWNAGTDNETTANGLYYSIRVGTVSLSSNIVSGVYGSPLLGNYIRPTISASQLGLNLLKMKDETTYYWSVQTIDNGLAKSNWSTEQSVYLPLNYPPNAPLSPLCEGKKNPINVTNFTPEFSWTFSDDNGEMDMQTACQILVADSLSALNSDNGNMWNPGKVNMLPSPPPVDPDTNIALNKPTAASSVTQYASTQGHEKAVDGNMSTRWSSHEPASQTEWIWVDLGYKYKINKVVIYWQEAYADSYKIQVSTDCTNWEDVYYTDSGDGGTDEIIFESEVYGRYVRMYGLHIGFYGYSIWEMKVYGSAPSSFSRYNGLDLQENTTYYWKVRTWDACDVNGPYCEPQTFHMAFHYPPNPPLNPLCNGKSNPQNIVNLAPEFSWTFSDRNENETQSAYRIIIATSETNLALGQYIGDTGKIVSTSTVVNYPGLPLEGSTTYYWQVKTWDNYGTGLEGDYSNVQTFNMALFLLKESFIESDNTNCTVFGDIDSDGNIDCIVGNIGKNKIYINDGTGSFSLKEESNETDATSSISLGDIDNDGDLDYVVGNGYNQHNRIYINDGSGHFNLYKTLSKQDSTQSIVLGDIDNDGDLDLIEGNNGYNWVYKNYDGNFNLFGGSSELDNTKTIGMGDIDNDGDIDYIAGNDGNNRAYINDGSGYFSLSSSSSETELTYAISMGDINNDGNIDYIAGNDGNNRAYINDGSGHFSLSSSSSETELTYAIGMGDINNDGNIDYIAGNDGNNRVYINDGSGHFNFLQNSEETDLTYSISLGDIDNDGDLDYIAGNNGNNRIYKAGLSLYKPNNSPQAPNNVLVSFADGILRLIWTEAEDTETNNKSLYYNICIGTSSGQCNVISKKYMIPLSGNYLRPRISTNTLGISIKVSLINTTYYCKVQTIDSGWKASSFSEEKSIYVGDIPVYPEKFKGIAISTESICWEWTDNSNNEDGYRIKRYSTDDILYDTLISNLTFWIETDLEPNTSYCRYVQAYNEVGQSNSYPVCVYTLANPPNNLIATGKNVTSIIINWISGIGGNKYYCIERSIDGSNWIKIIDRYSELSYQDNNLKPGTTYWYRIKGYNGDEIITEASNIISVMTEKDIVPPAPPKDIKIVLSSGKDKIRAGDRLIITGKAEIGTSIYKVIVRDQNGNILTKGISNNIEIIPETDIIYGEIDLGDIKKNYPLVTAIKIEIVVQDSVGNISSASVSDYIEFASEGNTIMVYDNLFNPVKGETCKIRIELSESNRIVKMAVYNITGELIKTLIEDEYISEGIKIVFWDGKNEDGEIVASGVYLMHIQTNNFTDTKKVCIVK